MRIIFLFLVLIFGGLNLHAQTYPQLVEFADEKMEEGDFFYAIEYYQKAMDLDSNAVEINWKIAEAYRKYKDYKRASYYYAKTYAKENALIYPKSVFWLANMEKLNGDYEAALQHFKLAKKVFKKQRKSYFYKKSQQELRSCLWAVKAIRDTTDYLVKNLPPPVNTSDAELAPLFYDQQLWFTSLKADSIGNNEEVFSKTYSLQIYTADHKDSLFQNIQPLKGITEKDMNTANGTVSPDGKRFYFSKCSQSFECKIYVGKIKQGKITDVDSLGEIINAPGKVTTMPHCTNINGKEVLFFVSNREKTVGGLDIWYSTITAGNKYSKARNLGRDVNSIDDDITPFYDTLTNELYFSSSWHEGFGGQDIFKVKNKEMRFMERQNLGIPINSAQNDTYFVVNQTTNEFYFSTNRIGVKYAKNPTCCNDIYRAHLPVVEPPTRFESLTDLNKKLPVTLYFHNDEPNPKTRDTITKLSYLETYDKYVKLEDRYKKEYAVGLSGDAAEEAKEDIDDFFTEYVRQGVIDLDEFVRLLRIELDKGYEIEITVKGFASPLAKTDYNVNLTKRRISSLINYLYAFEDGVFVDYLDHTAENGGLLSFVQIPFGEYTANDLVSDNVNDKKNSIYSRKAALERKIEIQSVSFVKKDSSYAQLSFDQQIIDFGSVKKGEVLKHDFKFTNTGEETLEIKEIERSCSCVSLELAKEKFAPGEKGVLTLIFDTSELEGLAVGKLTLKGNIENGQKEITVTAEVK